ncbi:MAG TPA: biotin/lipoyl-containing protein [Micromonosporaceae bacterium]
MASPQPENTDDLLDAVYRHAIKIIDAAGGPMHRLRLRVGRVSVDLQWPVANPPESAGGETDEPTRSGDPDAAAASTGRSGATTGDPDTVAVTSPMVGTFYRAPQPGAAPYAEVGSVIEPGQQIGIVEAMKLMNPVRADQGGQVVEWLVADGTSVEFDQPLVRLAPVSR